MPTPPQEARAHGTYHNGPCGYGLVEVVLSVFVVRELPFVLQMDEKRWAI